MLVIYITKLETSQNRINYLILIALRLLDEAHTFSLPWLFTDARDDEMIPQPEREILYKCITNS